MSIFLGRKPPNFFPIVSCVVTNRLYLYDGPYFLALIGDIQSFYIPQVCGWPCGEDAVKIVVRAAWSVKTVDHHDNDEYLIVLGEKREGGESLKSGFNKVGLGWISV